ncbi:hypothetical protein DFP72DRAFT_193844 [Ephemerocybe angulata]|uniref:Uncharacterized protein n=1 Tax=Ephemerocybe angulata TaxID=980116 RepID=A0A8H6MBT9_9AGAR|nr:hypothetical protein DFP72DRAFT_193844 [Tulosesus angulatus]
MRLASLFVRNSLAVITSLAWLEKVSAQACDCQGAIATLYDGSTTCNPANRAKSCTWMIPNRCCTDTRGINPPTYIYYHSVSMYGIEDLPDGDAGWSMGLDTSRCMRTIPKHGNGCLNQGSAKTVASAGWDFCKDWPSVCPPGRYSNVTSGEPQPLPSADGSPIQRGCQETVSPDVVYIREKTGEAGRPFAESALYKLNAFGDVVDLDTLVVREGKISLFKEYIELHGDGLSGRQMEAMRVLAEEDAKQGALSDVMEKYLTDDLSLLGSKRCHSTIVV